MHGVGGSSGSLKDIESGRSIALQRSLQRLPSHWLSSSVGSKLKRVLDTGLWVKKDEQGSRSVQAIAHA